MKIFVHLHEIHSYMEIRHLRLIQKVAETGNLTRAAGQLFLTQSALSHQLKEIEGTYNGSVFTRVNKKMVPTEIGKRFLDLANQVLPQVESCVNEVREMVSGEVGTIRISTQCYTFYHWLSPILQSYGSIFPNVEVRIENEATFHTIQSLQNGQLDVAIINYELNDPANYNEQELFEDELTVVVPIDHKLASRKFIMPRDLVEENFITYDIPQGRGVTYQMVFEDHGVHPRKVTQVQLTEAILEMVRANLGVSIMAKWAVKDHINAEDLKMIPVTALGLYRKWYAVTLKHKQMPRHISGFIDVLKQHL